VKLRVIALSQKLPAWAAAACDEYVRRLPREFALQTVEIKPEPRGRGKTIEQILAAEGQRIAASTQGFHVVALDERGEAWTSARLAANLGRWRDHGLAVAFVIGSADGLSEAVKRDADVMMALSALTLPHALVRVLLAEQLYRAASLLQGHPYHRP
jgi:23S rRNA (pseudouridine1915-N3)-methyltransferase